MWYFSTHPKRWLFIPKKNLRLATPPCLCWDILLLLLSSSNVNQASLTSPDIFLRNKITYPSPVLGGLGLVGHGSFCSFFGLRRCFLCVEGWREEQKLEVTQTKSRIFWTLWRRKNLTLKPFRKNMAEFMLHSTLKRCKNCHDQIQNSPRKSPPEILFHVSRVARPPGCRACPLFA